MKISPFVAAALVGCLLPAAGLAQTSTRPTQPTQSHESTGMTSDSMADHHAVEGEVTKVDADKGWMDVKTSDGRMKVHFPPAALENVKVGDRVTLELGLTRSATR